MADWTEAAVREALACVEGAEWLVSTVGRGLDVVTATVGRIHVEIAPHAVRAAWTASESAFVPEIEVALWRSAAQHGVRACILALRTLVIATHGPEAWPWAMREGGPGVEFDERTGEWLRKEPADV